MELTAEERRRLRSLLGRLKVRNESILTHVLRGSEPDSNACYAVVDYDGSIICRVDRTVAHSVDDLGVWLAQQAGGVVNCTCGAELLAGEVGLCGPCEAATVMSLIRIRDQTA